MFTMIGQPKFQKLTRELAERFAKMTPLPGYRDVNKDHYDWLTKQVTDGTFRTCEWASCYCRDDQKMYLINGRHTAKIFADLNAELPTDIPVNIQSFICNTLEDAAKLYATFDCVESVITLEEINAVFAGQIDSLRAVPSQTINAAAEALAVATYGADDDGTAAIPYGDEPGALLAPHEKFVLWLDTVLQGDEAARTINRAGVITAMFDTYQVDIPAATEFWRLVRDGSGSARKSPDRKLREHLMMTDQVAGNRSSRSLKNANDAPRLRSKCIRAWNEWRRLRPNHAAPSLNSFSG